MSDGDESFISHLEALRGALLRCVAVTAALFPAGYFLAPRVISALTAWCFPDGAALHYFAPMEVFFVQLRLALVIALVLAYPWNAAQIWRFVLPAPNPKPAQGLVVTGVWVVEDGTRHRAGDAYGPVTADVTFAAERLPWAEAHFGGGDYDPKADPDGDGYANAEEALDLTDPHDPASRPAPPTLTLLADPPAQTPCDSWAGRFARFDGTDGESARTLLVQTRLPGGAWGAPTRSGSVGLRVVPLGAETEYRVGVADALGVAFLDGLPGGRADHVVWGDVYALACVDPRPRLVATLSADGTLTLRNLGEETLEAEVVPAVFHAEKVGSWTLDPPRKVTADASFTWPLPWLNGLTAGTMVTFTYDYVGDDLFFTPIVYAVNGEKTLVDFDVDPRWDDVETADITVPAAYPAATGLHFQLGEAIGDDDHYAIRTVTLTGRDVWCPGEAGEVAPTTFTLTLGGGGERAATLRYAAGIPPAVRGVYIRSNDPAEPMRFLPWPRLGYRLRLR